MIKTTPFVNPFAPKPETVGGMTVKTVMKNGKTYKLVVKK